MQTVKIRHRSTVDKGGNAKMTSAKPLVKMVKATYSDGRIMDTSGECWTVKLCNDADATYETAATAEV